ncbi:MAG: hypothetical protein ACTHJR_18085 [Sphingomonas sp.]|uniref:hypothetical protein n=1 Tax=Sphingomonas sp. TaxID=28214 RepID=UPI003F7D4DB0
MIIDKGMEYWRIAKRFHANRHYKMMKPVAVSDMDTLVKTSSSPAVRKHAQRFIHRHQKTSPRNFPNGDGPRVA